MSFPAACSAVSKIEVPSLTPTYTQIGRVSAAFGFDEVVMIIDGLTYHSFDGLGRVDPCIGFTPKSSDVHKGPRH